MDLIPLGPFMLDFDLLTLVLSAAAGYFAVVYRQRKLNADKKIRDKYFNTIILGLLTWKFSLVIFDFSTVMKYPLSLLYYDGGLRGAVLGVVFAILYLWLRTKKDGTGWSMNLDMTIWGWVTGSSLYFLMLIYRFPEQIWLYVLFVVIQCAAAWIILLKRHSIGNKAAFLVVLLLAGWGIHDYLDKQTGAKQTQPGIVSETGIKKGNTAPDFELMNLNGESVKLSDFAGKKVILNFWATWCPPCKAEMPHMERISQTHAEEAVVLGVNLTHTERSPASVSQFTEAYGLTFPIVLDEKGNTADTYRVRAYPTTYMIDSLGIIREIYQGAINEELMAKTLKRMN